MMYEELIAALNAADKHPCSDLECPGSGECPTAGCLFREAADAIEKLQQTVEQMKAIVVVEAQHAEMFDERDKRTLLEMAKSLPLQIIPSDPPKEGEG